MIKNKRFCVDHLRKTVTHMLLTDLDNCCAVFIFFNSSKKQCRTTETFRVNEMILEWLDRPRKVCQNNASRLANIVAFVGCKYYPVFFFFFSKFLKVSYVNWSIKCTTKRCTEVHRKLTKNVVFITKYSTFELCDFKMTIIIMNT